MKTTKILLSIIFIIAVLLWGCKEEEIKIEPLATVSMVNAVINGKVARLNTNLRDSCLVMNYKHFTIKAGISSQIKAYASSTPNSPYFNQSPNTESGGIYSLYLTGNQVTPEAVFVKDNIPPYPTDEVINVRLVNLSPNSVPLSLTLGNAPSVSVFSGIAYKQLSEFKTLAFPTPLPTSGNLFQIRDGGGNILLTYTMPATGTISQASSRRRNITIVVKGISGGSGSDVFGVFIQPHY